MPTKQVTSNRTKQPVRRTFATAGIEVSQNNSKRDERAPGGKAQPPLWFAVPNNPTGYSGQFDIVGAEAATYKGTDQVVLYLRDLNPNAMTPNEIYWCSFASNDERYQFVTAFLKSNTPIGPCVFQPIDSGQGMPYMKIVEVSSIPDDSGQGVPYKKIIKTSSIPDDEIPY